MLKKLFSIAKTLLVNPKTILRVLSPKENESQEIVNKKYGFKHGLPIVSLSEFVVNSSHTISPYLFLEGGSLPTDHFLLAQLAQQEHVKTYLEIGTWRGESIMNVEQFVEKAYTLNLTDKELIRRGAKEDYVKQSGMLIPKENQKITQLLGDSLTFDFSPWKNSCDLVFIDGDHHYNVVLSDTKKALAMLKDENSFLVWHDYGHSPEDIRWEILLAILDAVPKEEHKFLYHVSNTKCALYTKKPLLANVKGRPLRPDTIFDIQIKMRKI